MSDSLFDCGSLRSEVGTRRVYELRMTAAVKGLMLILAIADSTIQTGLPKKVAIIGGGIGGLALRLAFPSWIEEVKTFESRLDALQSDLGGGIQISGGGLVIQQLGLYDELVKCALPLSRVRTRNRKGQSIMDVNLARAVQTYASNTLTDSSSRPMLYTIMRDSLMKILHDAPGLSWSGSTRPICSGMQCTDIQELSSGFVDLKFADGTIERNFDMVIGADGVNSMVRRYVASQQHSGRVDGPRPQPSGLRIAYAITPPTTNDEPQVHYNNNDEFQALNNLRAGCRDELHQWLGDGVYALTGTYGGQSGVQHMLAVVYHQHLGSIVESAPYGDMILSEWEGAETPKVEGGPLDRMQRILEVGGLQQLSDVQAVLKAARHPGGRSFDIAVKERLWPLQHWASPSGRVILMGDSAHSM